MGEEGKAGSKAVQVLHHFLRSVFSFLTDAGHSAGRLINVDDDTTFQTSRASASGAAQDFNLAGLGVTVPSWFEPLYHDSGNDRVGQLLLPFPQYQSGAVGSASGITTNCCLENLGQSTYHALEAKLERRFRNGLNLLASYTFSKTLTDADSAYAGLTAFNSSDTFNAQNPHDLRSEKALSYQDVPHMFVLSYLYELPVGKGKKFLNKGGVADKVLGGWQIGAVQRYQKGVPFIPFANDANFAGIAFGTPNPRLSRVPGQPLLAPDASSYNPFLGGSGIVVSSALAITAALLPSTRKTASSAEPSS